MYIRAQNVLGRVCLWAGSSMAQSVNPASKARIQEQGLNASTSSDRFELTLKAMSASVRKGAPIILDITISNVSGHFFRLRQVNEGHHAEWNDFSVSGLDAGGQALTPILPRKSTAESVVYFEMKPGRAIHDSLIASNLLVISTPGTYTLQVSHTNKKTHVVTVSNQVTSSGRITCAYCEANKPYPTPGYPQMGAFRLIFCIRHIINNPKPASPSSSKVSFKETCSARTRIWFDAELIVYGLDNPLPGTEVPFCCFHGLVSEKKLDLLQLSTSGVTESGAGTA